MSSNDFGLFISTVVHIFDGVYDLLMKFKIAGVPVLVVFLGLLAFGIFVKIVRHISLGGGDE